MQRQKLKKCELLALKMEKGAQTKESRQPLEARKDKETDPALELPEGTQPYQNLD